MTSNKAAAALLAELFAGSGNETIVISPGSRNAPLILSFAQHPDIKALPIVDERCAAFFALGIAQQSGKTVALACTSGTAALNYAPAIAEAYYQKIPLLIITADRPAMFVDQGDGQTIRQKNIYANYIKGSFEIKGDINSEKELEEAARLIQEAIHLTQFPDSGPVHLNMPFAESIYGQIERRIFGMKMHIHEKSTFQLNEKQIVKFAERWNASPQKLIIAGQMNFSPALSERLKKIASDPSVVILSESTSNLSKDVPSICIDRVVNSFIKKDNLEFKPDLLISFGGHVVSKMVKAWLRQNKPKDHWHIDIANHKMNTYQCLTEGIQSSPEEFFTSISHKIIPVQRSTYLKIWKHRADLIQKLHEAFLTSCPYSDLLVFERLINKIPEDYILHFGNSTPVRYAQLFRKGKNFLSYSNRGTSGIDGTVSTAAGAAYANRKPTLLITGDLGFLYDSNALMNQSFPGNLRIIIINNGGGGIFRFIEGPGKTNQLETFFEAKHPWTARYIARNFDVPYYSAHSIEEVDEALPSLLMTQTGNKSAILEIFTPPEKNAEVLKRYFRYLS